MPRGRSHLGDRRAHEEIRESQRQGEAQIAVNLVGDLPRELHRFECHHCIGQLRDEGVPDTRAGRRLPEEQKCEPHRVGGLVPVWPRGAVNCLIALRMQTASGAVGQRFESSVAR